MSRQLLAVIIVGTHQAQSRMLSRSCLPAVFLKSALENLCKIFRLWQYLAASFLSALDIVVFTCLACLHCLLQNTVHVAADDLGQEVCRHTGPGGRQS